MHQIQLEFNLDNLSKEQAHLSILQKQIDDLNESMGKVRRKLFCEISELKKSYSELRKENHELKSKLMQACNEKTEWVYQEADCLFDVRKYKEA